MASESTDERGKFKPGNPGRPKGARNRLAQSFLETLAADFEQYGMEAVEKLRADNPAAYANVIAKLMPKLMELTGVDGGPIEQQITDRRLKLIGPGDSLEARTSDPLADSDPARRNGAGD